MREWKDAALASLGDKKENAVFRDAIMGQYARLLCRTKLLPTDHIVKMLVAEDVVAQ
jgi:hypothetical protein